MRHLLNLRTLVATVALAGAAMIGSSSVSAGHSCHVPQYYYKTVTVYETIRKPYEYSVVKYDHCGDAYLVTLTGWKTVQVPVSKRILVQY